MAIAGVIQLQSTRKKINKFVGEITPTNAETPTKAETL